MNGNLTEEDIKAIKDVFERVTYKLPDAMVREIRFIFEESRRSCLKCTEWQPIDEICDKYKARPPLKVIVSGCPDYDNIPF